MNRVSLSTITRIYLFPPMFSIEDGPYSSICNNSSGSTILVFMIDEWLFQLFFTISQASHNCYLSYLKIGMPHTKSLKTSFLISLKFRCESLWRHNQLSWEEAFVSKEIDVSPQLAIYEIDTSLLSFFIWATRSCILYA